MSLFPSSSLVLSDLTFPPLQKEMVRKARETPDQDDAFYIAAGIVAVENMRAAHTLKMYMRERIWKVRRGSPPLLSC
jgi:hypothetical protein